MDRIVWKEKSLAFLKKYRYALLVLVIGLVLMSLPEGQREVSTISDTPKESHPADTMEQQLEDILSQIEGAGKVRVLLTQQTGERYTYQTDDDNTEGSGSSSSRQNTVIITGSDRAQQGLIRQIDPPLYLGAVIVCQGADLASVRLAIVEAVTNATGLGANKVSVLKMK